MVEAPTWLVMPGYRYYGQQEELDFNKPNNAIGEYKAGKCTELAQQPILRLELQ